MKSEKITNHGPFMDSINYGTLVKVQANNQSFIDNKCVGNEGKAKPQTTGKKLAKTIGKPSQRHR